MIFAMMVKELSRTFLEADEADEKVFNRLTRMLEDASSQQLQDSVLLATMLFAQVLLDKNSENTENALKELEKLFEEVHEELEEADAP